MIPPKIRKVLAISAHMNGPIHAGQIDHADRHIFETGYEIRVAGEIKARFRHGVCVQCAQIQREASVISVRALLPQYVR